MEEEHLPRDTRHLRACLSCSLVRSQEEFLREGCANCEPYLKLKESRRTVLDCTSANFSGLVCLLEPAGSWVAAWQRLSSSHVRGAYAISVAGVLPGYAVREMKKQGVEYRPRDFSQLL